MPESPCAVWGSPPDGDLRNGLGSAQLRRLQRENCCGSSVGAFQVPGRVGGERGLAR